MPKDRPVSGWWFVVLFAAAVVLRLPVVAAGFAIDDPVLVEHAAASGGPGSVVLESWPPGVYRPLVTVHFAFCQHAFGDWAPGYHLVSIALHVIVTWLVWLLCFRLSGPGWPALCAALGFAVLPGSNEAIAWAASVGDLWAALFVAISVLLAVAATGARPRREVWLWAASLAAMVLGTTAKEPAIVAAVLAPLGAWLFGRRRPTWGWSAAFPAVAVAYVSWHATRVAGPGIGALILGNPWRCLTSTVQNLVMAVVPIGRNAVGDFLWGSQGLARAVTFGGVAVIGLLLALAVRRRDRVTTFGLAWAVAALLPVCGMPWGERYAYLPAIGLAVVAAAFLSRAQGARSTAVKAAIALVLVVFALGSLLSAVRWTRRVGRFQNRSSIAAQWKPAPKAVSSTRSPFATRPCWRASHRASGTDADPVLP